MRKILRYIPIIGVLLVAACASAPPPEGPPVIIVETPCGGDVSSIWSDAKAAVELNGGKVNELSGVRKANVVAAYNAVPPATNHRPEVVAFVSLPGLDVVLLVFVTDGCVFLVEQVPAAEVENLLRGPGRQA